MEERAKRLADAEGLNYWHDCAETVKALARVVRAARIEAYEECAQIVESLGGGDATAAYLRRESEKQNG